MCWNARMRRRAAKRAVVGVGAAVGVAAGAVVLERSLLAAPRYHGAPSDHFDGDRFFNAEPSRQSGFLRWQLTREPGWWPEWIDAPPGPAPPGRVEGKGLRLTFINHATMLIQTGGVNILTDPIWSERTSPVSFLGPRRHRPPGIRFDDLPAIDVVLISHNHYDHLDVATLRRLQAGHRPRFVTPLGNGALLRRHGIDGALELDWWESAPLPLRVHAVPARHFCARGFSDHDRNLWCGFVVEAPGGNVYFAGDTGWGAHFAEIGRRFAPVRLAFLPIGAYLPRWFMHPVHTDPDQAVRAHAALGASTSVAMHFGTFALGDDGYAEPLRDLRAALERASERGEEPRFWALDEGVGKEIPPCEP
jgi:L-ascorbate metabolism protein UlaG (beta-lactamase superfamily)